MVNGGGGGGGEIVSIFIFVSCILSRTSHFIELYMRIKVFAHHNKKG